jgi:hypothetical protein
MARAFFLDGVCFGCVCYFRQMAFPIARAIKKKRAPLASYRALFLTARAFYFWRALFKKSACRQK